jgi:glyoxylase-like metal-dependent hydrolase (beta-lactamase superfamily II)
MTLFRGSREIQLKFLGRGHTAGDVVVYLPREKIVITGDFLTAGMSNLSDSYPNEWADSLDALKKLDFTTVLPGHGEAYTDKVKIDNYQAYLRDAWAQASTLKQQGVSAEDAVKRIDMGSHKERFPPNTNLSVNLLGVQRMYELLDARR